MSMINARTIRLITRFADLNNQWFSHVNSDS